MDTRKLDTAELGWLSLIDANAPLRVTDLTHDWEPRYHLSCFGFVTRDAEDLYRITELGRKYLERCAKEAA